MASVNIIKLAMKKWLNQELGFTWVFEEQAQPKTPARPYGTIRYNDSGRVGFDDYRGPVSALGVATLKGVRGGTISLNIYGTSALEEMELARDSMFKEETHSLLWNTYGISLMSVGNIQNLTGLLETDFEERAQMDVMINYAREITDNVGLIEHVNIDGEADGHIINQEIDLP